MNINKDSRQTQRHVSLSHSHTHTHTQTQTQTQTQTGLSHTHTQTGLSHTDRSLTMTGLSHSHTETGLSLSHTHTQTGLSHTDRSLTMTGLSHTHTHTDRSLTMTGLSHTHTHRQVSHNDRVSLARCGNSCSPVSPQSPGPGAPCAHAPLSVRQSCVSLSLRLHTGPLPPRWPAGRACVCVCVSLSPPAAAGSLAGLRGANPESPRRRAVCRPRGTDPPSPAPLDRDLRGPEEHAARADSPGGDLFSTAGSPGLRAGKRLSPQQAWSTLSESDTLPAGKDIVHEVDEVRQCCLVRFEDNSEFWVLRKDIHSFSAALEGVCCVCEAPPHKDPLFNCRKCRHGYHPQCHTPAIEPEADSSTWVCRQCVFAVATKRGGAMKRGRFARLMQAMKVRLPYQLSALDWDPQHLTNQQQCYCYCAGPGEWNLKMLQCRSCGQWFHEACTQCLSKPLLYGDRFYHFDCSVCTTGPEAVSRLPMSWVDLAHLVLYHLSLCCRRKYFDFEREILSFANENWDSLLLGPLSDTPKQDRSHNLLNALTSHKDRFVSGKEIKKKKCLFGLQVRAPPPLTSDPSPLTPDPPATISHKGLTTQTRRRASLISSPSLCLLSSCVSPVLMTVCLCSDWSTTTVSLICSLKPRPQDVMSHPAPLSQCYQGYVGGASVYSFRRPAEPLSACSPPKRMFASCHPSSCRGPPDTGSLHHYSDEDPCQFQQEVLPLSRVPSQLPDQKQKQESCPPLLLLPPPCPRGPGAALGDGCGVRGEAVRILARRVIPDGTVQYLVEWGNVRVC
ncbi:PHF1 protein, partial [Atractosteus spatula]|nr:PHF1 protein [Atractosteus spatula]